MEERKEATMEDKIEAHQKQSWNQNLALDKKKN